MRWTISDRCDPTVRPFADRHYNRQSVGAKNFVPPGRCLVLREERGFWVTSWPLAEYVHHAWPGAWICSAFRLENGGPEDASGLIREALAATVWQWPSSPSVFAWRIRRRHDRSDIEPIRVAMVTMVDPAKTNRKRDPGRCFRRAGFVEIGQTKTNRLVVLGLPVNALPKPEMPTGAQLGLDIVSVDPVKSRPRVERLTGRSDKAEVTPNRDGNRSEGRADTDKWFQSHLFQLAP